MVPTTYTNNTPLPQGGCLLISGQDTNANMVPLANITPVPHGGFIPFSGQGTNSNLITSTKSTSTPQGGFILCSCQGVDLKVMSQTLCPPVQSTQNSNTSNQYLQYITEQQA